MGFKMVSGPQEGAHGGGYSIIAVAHANLVKGAPYHFNFDATHGYITRALTAAAGTIGVAKEAYLLGQVGEFVVQGVVEVLLAAAQTPEAGDALTPDTTDPSFTTSDAAPNIIVGQAANTVMGIALEASTAGGELIDAYVDGMNMTATA